MFVVRAHGTTFPCVPLSRIVSVAFVFILVANNVLYQTSLQVNQISLVVALIAVCLFFNVHAVNKKFLILISISSLIYLVTLFFLDGVAERNRAIFFYSSSVLYLLLIFNGHKISVPDSFLYFYLVIFFVISILILSTSDRDFVNPNWISATFFFLLAFSKPMRRRKMVFFLLIGLILSALVYESRGSTVIFGVALLAMVSQRLFGDAIAKRLYLFVYLLFVIAFWFFLNLLSSEFGYFMDFIFQFSDRGLGGRESALIQGYLDLKESGYIGAGPASSGGYIDPSNNQPVHIHFGFLDIALKFSILSVLFVLILMRAVILKASFQQFPMVAASFMTVFFYNGIAFSHFGLNVFVIALMSKVLFSKANI